MSDAHGVSARRRLATAAAVGVVAGGLAFWLGPWDLAPLAGWDAAAVVLVGWIWAVVRRLDAEGTARQAVREDPTAATADVLVLAAAVASLLTVGFVIVRTDNPGSAAALGRIGLGVASVVLSWTLVHTVFTLRYADLYYTADPVGGIDFHTAERPCYRDFAYVAFTIGMTFQVCDTDLQSGPVRHTALRHSLLAYLFGAVILASTINLVANLLR